MHLGPCLTGKIDMKSWVFSGGGNLRVVSEGGEVRGGVGVQKIGF